MSITYSKKQPRQGQKRKVRRHGVVNTTYQWLDAILLLDKGHSCVEVGEILLLDANAIRTYRNTYLNEGAESLLSDNNKGTTTFLTSNQLEDLEKHLIANVYTDSKGIVAWVENNFGIRYSCSGINALLNSLGFVYKKPILTSCKANVEKQEAFVKQYKELKEHLKEQTKSILWMVCIHSTTLLQVRLDKKRTKNI